MKKTLFLTAVLALVVGQPTYAWSGGADAGIDTSWAGISINQGHYVNNNITGKTLDDTNHQVVGLTPEGATTTAQIDAVNLKDGAELVCITNQWSPAYARKFQALTIDKLNFGATGSGAGSLTVRVKDGQGADSMTINVKAVDGALSSVKNEGVLTLGSDAVTTTITGMVLNTGTLNLKGTLAVDSTNAAAYTVKSAGSETWSDAANAQGFLTVNGATFYAIKGASVLLDGATVTGATLDEEGNYVFSKETSTSTTYVVNAETAAISAADAAIATGYDVQHEGAKIVFDGAGISLAPGDFTANGHAYTIGLTNGAAMTVSTGGSVSTIKGVAFEIGADSKLVLGAEDALGWSEANGPTSFTLEGSVGHMATLELNAGQTGVTDIAFKGYSQVTGTSNMNAFGDENSTLVISATGKENHFDAEFKIRRDVTVDVAADSELTFKNVSHFGGGFTGSMNKTGDGVLTFKGTLTNTKINGDGENTLITGATIAAGNTLSNLVISDSTLNSSIAIGENAVTFSGTITMGGTGETLSSEETFTGLVSGYGVVNTTKKFTVVTEANMSKVVNNATWMVGEGTTTLAADGTVTGIVTSQGAWHTVGEADMADVQGNTVTVEAGSTLSITSGYAGNGKTINNANGGTLLLNGMTGYFNGGSALGNVKVGEDGAYINNGYSNSGFTTIGNLDAVEGGTITFGGDYGASDKFQVTGEVSENLNIVNERESSAATTMKFDNALNINSITAESGTLKIIADSVMVNALTFGGGTLDVRDSTSAETTITTTVLNVNADSTLNANLVTTTDSQLYFNGTLTMGSTVEFGAGTTIIVSDDIAAQIESGAIVTLIDSIDADADITSLAGVGIYKGSVETGLIYITDTHVLTHSDGTFYVTTPEPATATLSLLALAGLCARRRRH